MFKESFSKQDSSFLKSINYKLAKISWQPAKYNLQKVNSVFTVPFVMFFKNSRKYLDIYYGKKRGSYNSRYSSNMGNADYSDPIIKVRDAGILESSMIR
jgi:hypothetical protein